MTRINVGIDPKTLNRQMLIAEHREIKRIPNVIKSGRFSMTKQPSEFTLGTGHVKFFYDKILFLKNRYESIYNECINRGYNVTYFGSAFDGIPRKYMNDYHPSARDKQLLEERIAQRLKPRK
jgi:hypothetical protein